MMAARAGFDCRGIVLPYADDSDLENNAKLAQLFATKTGRKNKQSMQAADQCTEKGFLSALLKEKIISKILIQCQARIITFPLTTAVHPIWFIESVIQDAVFAGKIPIAPMISLSSELGNYAKEVGIDLLNFSPPKVPKVQATKVWQGCRI